MIKKKKLVWSQKDKCNGCTSCVDKCPKNAITMEKDREGFRYAVIDLKKCINCGICRKVCENNVKYLHTVEKSKIWGAWNTDSAIRKASSSGGVFSALASNILKNNGVVIGACYDNEKKITKHVSISDISELHFLRQSKYIQSENIEEAYELAKKVLSEKRQVLFSGTPCQISGLYKSITGSIENLFTCDVVCHGVASQSVFETYINKYESSNNKIINVLFRDKRTGWHNFGMTISLEDSSEVFSTRHQNAFLEGYGKCLFMRPSCFGCQYSTTKRVADITLGDFWNIEKKDQARYNDEGISLVMLNNKKGENLFMDCKEHLQMWEYCENDISELNAGLRINNDSEMRNLFFEKFINSKDKFKVINEFVWKSKEEIMKSQKKVLRRIFGWINIIY